MKLFGRSVAGLLRFVGGPLEGESWTAYAQFQLRVGSDVLLVAHPSVVGVRRIGSGNFSVIQNWVRFNEYAKGWHLSVYRFLSDSRDPASGLGQVLAYVETYERDTDIQQIIDALAPGADGIQRIDESWLNAVAAQVNRLLKNRMKRAPAYCSDHLKLLAEDFAANLMDKLAYVASLKPGDMAKYATMMTDLTIPPVKKKTDEERAVDAINDVIATNDDVEPDDDVEEGDLE